MRFVNEARSGLESDKKDALARCVGLLGVEEQITLLLTVIGGLANQGNEHGD